MPTGAPRLTPTLLAQWRMVSSRKTLGEGHEPGLLLNEGLCRGDCLEHATLAADLQGVTGTEDLSGVKPRPGRFRVMSHAPSPTASPNASANPEAPQHLVHASLQV